MVSPTWQNLAQFLKERRELIEYSNRIRKLRDELNLIRKEIDGGSKYRIVNISIHPDDIDDPECFQKVGRQLIEGNDAAHVAKNAKPATRAFSEWFNEIKNFTQFQRKTVSDSCLYPIWLIWTKQLVEINSSTLEGGALKFDIDCWKSGTTITGKEKGVTGKNFSNLGQFDLRVLDAQLSKNDSKLHEMNKFMKIYQRKIRSMLLNSDSIRIIHRGPQSVRELWTEINQVVIENPYAKATPHVWVIGLEQRRQQIMWCRSCISSSFNRLSQYDSEPISVAPMSTLEENYECLSDNCSGIIKVDATDVLNIGFKQLRSDKRIIETISIDLESSLIEVNDFRKKFGSSVIIDGRINLDENVS